jgi:hypothetical protein
MHPVGPLPPGAYWLRRLVAALAVIVVVVLAWWAWGALTGDGGGSSPTPSLTTSPGPSTASSTPSATASPTATPKPTATATPSPAATTAAVAALCPAAAIEVTVATDRTAYSAGQRPKITLTVTNTGSSACRRDVGQKALELQISTGGKRFWSSDDCAPGGGASLRLLGPDASYRTTVVWQRTGSQPGCPADRPAAPAGEYQVVGRDLDVRSEPATFTLR